MQEVRSTQRHPNTTVPKLGCGCSWLFWGSGNEQSLDPRALQQQRQQSSSSPLFRPPCPGDRTLTPLPAARTGSGGHSILYAVSGGAGPRPPPAPAVPAAGPGFRPVLRKPRSRCPGGCGLPGGGSPRGQGDGEGAWSVTRR